MDFYTFFIIIISILVIGFLIFCLIVKNTTADEMEKKTNELVEKTTKKKEK